MSWEAQPRPRIRIPPGPLLKHLRMNSDRQKELDSGLSSSIPMDRTTMPESVAGRFGANQDFQYPLE